jgi:PAB-dependent poly(A)-specific ribonuclease subunit 3
MLFVVLEKLSLTDIIALVVAYEHHPSAKTLSEEYLKHITSAANSGTSTPVAQPTGGRHAPFGRTRTSTPPSARIPERTLWTYIVQIANAVKAVHDAGMAVRVLDTTKVLITGKNRYDKKSCL